MTSGKMHDGPPLARHVEASDTWLAIPAEDRERWEGLSSDQCIVDGRHFFIRGLVEIPVVDGEGPFAWGVWVSLSRANFQRAEELWNDPRRVDEPAYFAVEQRRGIAVVRVREIPETANHYWPEDL